MDQTQAADRCRVRVVGGGRCDRCYGVEAWPRRGVGALTGTSLMRLRVHHLTVRSMTLVAFETILIVSAVVAAAYVRFSQRSFEILLDRERWHSQGPDHCGCRARLSLLRGPLRSSGSSPIAGSCSSASPRRSRQRPSCSPRSYFWFPALIVGRGVFMIAALSGRGAVVGWRIAFEWFSRRVRPRERLLLVGTNPAAIEACPGAVTQAARARRRDRRLHRSGPGAGRQPGAQPRRDRHDRRHSVHRAQRAASIASSSACATRAASCRWTSCSR